MKIVVNMRGNSSNNCFFEVYKSLKGIKKEVMKRYKNLIALSLPIVLASCTTTYMVPQREVQVTQAPPQVVETPEVAYAPNQFYNDLAPYGTWIQLGGLGLVWQPGSLPYGWRPYSDGYWVYTNYGWTYQSDTPYGWAVYHYGRWALDRQFGWVWLPGDEWAPAWVAWRDNGDYIGWAPLPPSARWEQGGFYGGGVNIEVGISNVGWCFVPHRHFAEWNVYTYMEAPNHNVTIIQNSRSITNYTIINNTIINNSVNVHDVERYSNRRIDRYDISDARSRNDVGFSHNDRNELKVYRPRFDNRTTRPANNGSQRNIAQPNTGRDNSSVNGGGSNNGYNNTNNNTRPSSTSPGWRYERNDRQDSRSRNSQQPNNQQPNSQQPTYQQSGSQPTNDRGAGNQSGVGRNQQAYPGGSDSRSPRNSTTNSRQDASYGQPTYTQPQSQPQTQPRGTQSSGDNRSYQRRDVTGQQNSTPTTTTTTTTTSSPSYTSPQRNSSDSRQQEQSQRGGNSYDRSQRSTIFNTQPEPQQQPRQQPQPQPQPRQQPQPQQQSSSSSSNQRRSSETQTRSEVRTSEPSKSQESKPQEQVQKRDDQSSSRSSRNDNSGYQRDRR